MHTGAWFIVLVILSLVFQDSMGSKINSFYFVSMLLPIIAGTYYFLNYFLIPKYLLKSRYLLFGLYFFYTLVVSVYLELVVMMFSYIFLADYKLGKMEPYASDIIVLAMVLYLVVFAGSFLFILYRFRKSQRQVEILDKEKKKREKGFFEVRSERRKKRIQFDSVLYIESLADYVKIHLDTGKNILSKERISKLNDDLPANFVRIHRSFIANSDKINSYNYEAVRIGEKELTISRSYKKKVMEEMKVQNKKRLP